jgi:hypothetical protein
MVLSLLDWLLGVVVPLELEVVVAEPKSIPNSQYLPVRVSLCSSARSMHFRPLGEAV